MRTYSTDVSQIELDIPVFLAYAEDGKPIIVTGVVKAYLHLGKVFGKRPIFEEDKEVPGPLWGLLEINQMILPDKTGFMHRPIFIGHVEFVRSFAAPSDWPIIESAKETLKDFVTQIRTKEPGNIPILFYTFEEAQEFLSENIEFAEKATKHYAQALVIESRTKTVGYDGPGISQPINPKEDSTHLVKTFPNLITKELKESAVKKTSNFPHLTGIPKLPS